MKYSILRARPQALVGILIATFGILSFQAVCNIFLTATIVSVISCSVLLPVPSQIACGSSFTYEMSVQHDTILAAISELSSSLSQMNASLESLHAKLDQNSNPINALEHEEKLSAAQKWPSGSSSYTMSAQELVIVWGIVPTVLFFVGVATFLEDATHKSKSFATGCFLVFIGAANTGLAFAVFGVGYLTWEKYVYRTAWPIALSMAGLAFYEGSRQRTPVLVEGEKVT